MARNTGGEGDGGRGCVLGAKIESSDIVEERITVLADYGSRVGIPAIYMHTNSCQVALTNNWGARVA